MKIKVKNPVIAINTKFQDQQRDANSDDQRLRIHSESDIVINPVPKISSLNYPSSSLIKMVIKVSIITILLIGVFIFLYPKDKEMLTSAMKFKRVCFIGLDLAPYKMKRLGPNTLNVLDTDNPDAIFDEAEGLKLPSTLRQSFKNFNIFDANGTPIFDPKYCTHINVIPAHVHANGTLLPRVDADVDKYKSINSLRTFNPSIKILISVCGNNDDWSSVTASNETRNILASNILKFMSKYGFDGVDFDWEYPVYSSFKWSERSNFIELLKTVRRHLDAEFGSDESINFDPDADKNIVNRGNFINARNNHGHQRKILTIDVPGDVTIVIPGYDVVSINRIVDWINLMTYDLMMFKPLYPFTGFNGALYPKSNQGYYFSTLNVASAAYLWNHLGMDKDKIVIGVPTYARSYILYDKSMNYVGAPAKSAGNSYSFGDVCDILKRNGSSKVWDVEAKVPFVVSDDVWISYEDGQSASEKAKFIRAHKFGGAMTFSLNSDDFDGRCNDGDGNDNIDTNAETRTGKFKIQAALYRGLK